MKNALAQPLKCFSAIAMLVLAGQTAVPAEPVPVHHTAGTIHGFLELRSEEGSVLASGDLILVTRSGKVTSSLVFHFKDGSLDDDTTVFSQHGNFQLISDHHIQKGPFFSHPMDLTIDAHSGNVTVRSTGKDGKDETKTNHMDLPPDLANGMLPYIMQNLQPGAADLKVSMLVVAPKPRLVTLAISSRGDEPFSLAGSSRMADHYEIKIELGGITGVVAPLAGKQPPDIEFWTLGGQAPTFVKEQGPIYAEGPVVTIELTSPAWPGSRRSGE